MKRLSWRLGLVLPVLLCWLVDARAQQTGPPPEKQETAGVATGGAHRPVLDNLRRPVTAGGLVEGAPIVFQDITAAAGLAAFRTTSGGSEKKYILEVETGGLALFDYDGDGWLDIYLVNGSTFAGLQGKEPAPRAALFRNNGDGTFVDVTEKAGVANQGWGFGAAVADIDNDGWDDLYVTNFGANRLYRNNGDGTFTDIAAQAGVTVGVWSTAAAFADYDRDGFVDLFVAGYIRNPPLLGTPEGDTFCSFRGRDVYCGPRGLPGERDFLFHNNGDGTFTEVSQRAGVSDTAGHFGLAVAWVDVNDDGWVDLLVANDSVPNYLYLNRGDGTFEDASLLSGFALNENGREQASMGIAVGDYNHDGLVDLYVPNFSDDYNTLYRNEGDGNFVDISRQLGLADPTIPFLGWGTGFIDYDNDGHKDLFVANGHIYRSVDEFGWGTTWAQRPLLFRNLDGRRFDLVPAAPGSGLGVVVPARGAAFGDLDGDGRIDVVLNNLDAPPTVLRNVVEPLRNWLLVQLVGGPQSGRNAIGAVVRLQAGGLMQRADVVGGGSFSSHSDFRLHFGLGSAPKVDSLEVRWPSGLRERFPVPAVNRVLRLTEGAGEPVPGKPATEATP